MFNLPNNAEPCTHVFKIYVTPELAAEWLRQNNFNRPYKASLIANYARQMRAGLWRCTHQGIAMTEKGTLLDGQHRLHAVVESGVTVQMILFINESLDKHMAVDGGKKRSLLDVIRLEMRGSTVRQPHITTLKSMMAGAVCKSMNHWNAEDIVPLLRRHFRAIDWTVDVLGSKRQVVKPTTLGVVARAYYNVSIDRLLEFCNVYVNGVGTHPSLKIIQDLRSYVLATPGQGEYHRRELYLRTQLALNAFVHNATTCEEPRECREFYPLPGLF